MQTTPPPRAAAPALGDFTADPRMLMLAAMAVAIGAGGALAALVLTKLIYLVTNIAWFGRLSFANTPMGDSPLGGWGLLIPVAGSVIIGLMARFGSEKIRGHGIPEAIEAILFSGSRLSPKVAVLKPISSAISIGTGGPFGAEGPIIMTGGALGSLFAQCFRLTAAERKTLLVAGAAAGMTGVFGTPLAAILLAVEVLLFELKPRSLIPVIVGSLTAAALRPVLLAQGPLFPFAHDPALPPWSLALFLLVGAMAGLQAGLISKTLYAVEDAFHRLPIHWMWWPAIGGVVVGLGGLIEPQALGAGYANITHLLAGELDTRAALLLLAVKTVIWIVALGSGTSGGVLAPLLIMGGAFGALEAHLLPGPAGFWVLLAMTGTMSGAMRAPLTAAVFAMELTGDRSALPALLAASGAAYAVAVLTVRRSILTEKIARRGRHILQEFTVDPFESTRVAEVMVREVDTLSTTMLVDEAVAQLSQHARHRIYPLLDPRGRPVGMVSRADALQWMMEGSHGARTLGEAASDASLPTVFPDDLISRVADLMISADIGRLAVVDPKTHALVGLISRRDVLRARAKTSAVETNRQAYLRRAGEDLAA